MELVGVEGLTIDHSAGSLLSGGTFVITSIPSLKLFAEGNGAYSGTLTFTFSGGTYSEGTSGSALGSGSIVFTAATLKDGGNFVLREKDTGTVAGVYGNPSGGTLPFSTSVEITDANQTKLFAN